jgi:hypothetical protein
MPFREMRNGFFITNGNVRPQIQFFRTIHDLMICVSPT